MQHSTVTTTLPNFMIIGASKCGTTSLWEYLNRHPDVFWANPKEPMYFNWELKRPREIEWYASLFADAADKQAIGEATTSYTYAPHTAKVPQRIHQLLPDCKLVYILRPPVARTYSHYVQ
ncbi:sulfotransferase domain-containing protein, partial [Planctomycetota bacterium]